MGSPKWEGGRHPNETQHEVTLTQGFWLGKCQVSQDEWERVMDNNPSDFQGPQLPVEQISWNRSGGDSCGS